MNGKLERYLNSACAGLFGLERQTVRDELEANLLERVREFQVMGRTRADALEGALEEFGAPSSVRRGMREVYIMPKVMKGGVLLGVLAMGAYLGVSSSVAGPVPISLCVGNRIEPQILEQGCPSLMSFLKLEDIQADFAKQGFQLTADQKVFKVERNGKALLDLEWTNPKLAVSSFQTEQYINLNSLLTFDLCTQNVQVPVTFDRLLNPTITFAGARLSPKASVSKSPVDITASVAWRIACFVHQAIDPKSQEFGYGGMTITCSNHIVYGRVTATESSFNFQRTFSQTLERVGKPGKVYTLAWIRKDSSMKRDPTKNFMNEFVETSLATADARGTLKFNTYQPRLEYTNSLEEFKQARGKKAILLELTGRLDNAAPAFVVVQNPPSSSGTK